MKTLAVAALLAGMLVACGGNDSKPKPVDANGDGASLICSPLTQMGCMPNEKCTWVIDQTDPVYVGHVGCVAAGSADIDATCTYGVPGATGYDNCVKGAVCSEFKHPGKPGFCKAICDQNGGKPMCDQNHACILYSKLFSTGSTSPAAAGVCNHLCDPLLDNDFDGSGSASHKRADGPCGSDTQVGCYAHMSRGTPPATAWTCTGDIHTGSDGTDLGFRHRSECTVANTCADSTSGLPFVNSCNQGYEAVLIETTGSTTAVCIAECHPLDCYDGSNGHCGGSGNPNRHGLSPDACDTTHRVGIFQTGSGREECAYSWNWEAGSAGDFLRSDTSDTVGFCMDHFMYKYDPSGGNSPTMPLPGCEALQLHGTHNAADLSNPTVYFGAADLGFACVGTALALGSATGKPLADPNGIAIDQPRFLYHREMGQ